jgi:hypothetical protein
METKNNAIAKGLVFSHKTLLFHIVTVIRYALLPAMNKSLHAALAKICTSG